MEVSRQLLIRSGDSLSRLLGKVHKDLKQLSLAEKDAIAAEAAQEAGIPVYTYPEWLKIHPQSQSAAMMKSANRIAGFHVVDLEKDMPLEIFYNTDTKKVRVQYGWDKALEPSVPSQGPFDDLPPGDPEEEALASQPVEISSKSEDPKEKAPVVSDDIEGFAELRRLVWEELTPQEFATLEHKMGRALDPMAEAVAQAKKMKSQAIAALQAEEPEPAAVVAEEPADSELDPEFVEREISKGENNLAQEADLEPEKNKVMTRDGSAVAATGDEHVQPVSDRSIPLLKRKLVSRLSDADLLDVDLTDME